MIFLNAYQKLNEYQYRDSNHNIKKFQTAITNLAYSISHWTRSSAPTSISELPDSIGDNLENLADNLFEENNSDKIKNFVSLIEKMTMYCYSNEPTAKLLRAFNEEILEIKIDKIQKIEKKKSSNQMLKLIWIPPVLGIVLFALFNHVDSTQVHASLGYSLSISVILLVVVLTLVRRNK